MKSQSYPLAIMAIIVLASVTIGFGQKQRPSGLVKLSNAKEAIEQQAALFKAMSSETTTLKRYQSAVAQAYGDVKLKYQAFKSFIKDETLRGKKVETVSNALKNDKTYGPALENAIKSYKKKLDDVYAKGLESKPLVSPTGGFDPSELITGLFAAIAEWIQGDLGRKWEERQKLLETLDAPDYTLKEYSEIKAAY